MKIEFATYLFDGFLSFLDLAVLDITKSKEVVAGVNRNFAAQDLSKAAELGVEVLVSPLAVLKPLDEDAGTLHIFASWLTTNRMKVVRESSAHRSALDLWIPMLLYGSLGIFNGVKHYKCVVEVLEQGSLDADLAGTNMLLIVVCDVKIGCVSRKVGDEDHLVSIFGCNSSVVCLFHHFLNGSIF